MTDITNIPLNKLTAWEGNVRKTQSKAGIDDLAASIKAHGLQQNLVVMKVGKTFAVVAGGRRLKALQLLAKAGDIQATYEVPCTITEAGDASEISLAENVIREDMHPADQFEAFRELADKGEPAADIGARFGRSESHVMKLLKLARVSPKVLRAYRDGKLTLEDVMAFTVTDDHAAQEKVLKDFDPQRNDARDIRDSLTENDIVATDKRVKFVTLKTYEKAGGKIKRDLFSDDHSGMYIEDPALLNSLVTAKLEKKAASLRSEGWKWIQVMPEFGYQQRNEYKRIHAEPVPLTAAEQKTLDKFQAEYDRLNDEWNDSEDQEQPARLGELEKLINEIEDREGVWTPGQLAIAGAIVTIDHDGKASIDRGLVRPEDMPKAKGKSKASSPSNAGDDDVGADTGVEFSSSLMESLTAHRSAALAATLLDVPEKGLAVVVYAIALDVFGHSHETVLKMSASEQSLHRVEGSTAFQRLEIANETWRQRIPGTPDGIWQWCMEQDQSTLIDLLTFCAACTINAVQLKADRPECPRLAHATTLATALALDMKAWFTPNAENYFSRVSKAQVFKALQEARQQPHAPAWEKLKKAELAALAEREIAGTGWLPKPLR